MKIYEIDDKVYQYYRFKVKGNRHVTFEEAQRKLSRNVAMAAKIQLDDDKFLYLYGNLHIFIEGDKIFRIKNHWINNNWFYKNRQQQQAMNQELDLEDSKTSWHEVGDMSYIDEYAKGFKE